MTNVLHDPFGEVASKLHSLLLPPRLGVPLLYPNRQFVLAEFAASSLTPNDAGEMHKLALLATS